MPRQTVPLKLEHNDPTPMARLISYMAYPSPEQKSERVKFERSLCCAFLWWRGVAQPRWSKEPQTIRSAWLMADSELVMARCNAGLDLLDRRLLVGRVFLRPYFLHDRLLEKPRKLSQVFQTVPDIKHWDAPTVENMAAVYAMLTGMSENSGSNVKDDHWGPTKPVIHMAYTLGNWFSLPETFEVWESERYPPEKSGLEGWLDFVFYRAFFRSVDLKFFIDYAERIREQFPHIKAKFKIREQTTIKFASE